MLFCLHLNKARINTKFKKGGGDAKTSGCLIIVLTCIG